ncbi:MAG: hypothetical protein KJZ74_02180 [Gemmatimonadales bacterium]|nr:hypothetical protein [Gemmatimonadales bacterium]
MRTTTRFTRTTLAALAIAVASPLTLLHAQAGEESIAVKDGGILMAGWKGVVDAAEARRGLKITDAKIQKMGSGMHVTTGPATTYWDASKKMTGDYMVKATFNESKYMGLNNHPHPYGIMIAGNDLESESPNFLYCAAYGNGKFIFRGFSSTAPRGTFAMSAGRAGDDHPAVNKAAGKDQPVTQEIAMQVKGDKVSCMINGQEVASYPKADVIGEGKVKTLDGYVGVRFGHNTDAHVSGFAATKP